MFERAALIHYHEIGLKGRNRSFFEQRLRDNIAVLLDTGGSNRVKRISSRLILRVQDEAQLEGMIKRTALIPGVSSVSPCWITSRQERDISHAALLAAIDSGSFETFAVQARRSNTDHPVSSLEMNRRIGQYLCDCTGKRVDLTSPDVCVRVEVVQGDAYVYSRKIAGPGGLPVGTSGTAVALLSAGIDSPVATWRIAKRGAVMVGVHFSGTPHISDLSKRLVFQIGEVLERRGAVGRIYVVPFGDLQYEIALASPSALRILLYRRLMVRVAEAIAAFEKAGALVTGESLGQVSSQTLENIAVVDEAATMPVLRPLAGMDKVEIVEEAKNLGTFDISTQAHDDCCTLFMPRQPAAHARIADVLASEASLDVSSMVKAALRSMTYRDYVCPAYQPPTDLPLGAVAEPQDL